MFVKRKQPRRPKHLSNDMVVHNSGDALWNYLFYDTKLDYYDSVAEEEESDWYDEGVKWIESELLDGEMYKVMDNDPVYAFTSCGRHANIKSQNWKRLNLQCHVIAGNMRGGAISITKLVRDAWGLDITYHSVPQEARDLISIRVAPKDMREE